MQVIKEKVNVFYPIKTLKLNTVLFIFQIKAKIYITFDFYFIRNIWIQIKVEIHQKKTNKRN